MRRELYRPLAPDPVEILALRRIVNSALQRRMDEKAGANAEW
jgi:hypothetical protein